MHQIMETLIQWLIFELTKCFNLRTKALNNNPNNPKICDTENKNYKKKVFYTIFFKKANKPKTQTRISH